MLRKVHKKEVWHPPSARDYNAMAMAAESYLTGPDQVPERQRPVNPCTAWIKNSSGAARRQFECVELSVTPQLAVVTRENTWIDGIVPTNTGIPFAVLLQPAAGGTWALGQVSGICPGLVDIQDVDHRWAYLPAGEYVLKSCEMPLGTVCIVQHPNATGEQLCVILFNPEIGSDLVELCAQETASRDVPYSALLATWSVDDNIWCYDSAPTVTAIDHRMGAPYAETGWKGLYQAMPSTDYGTIYVCVSLDCSLPPEGCNTCEEA